MVFYLLCNNFRVLNCIFQFTMKHKFRVVLCYRNDPKADLCLCRLHDVAHLISVNLILLQKILNAISVDPDQMLHHAASDLNLYRFSMSFFGGSQA